MRKPSDLRKLGWHLNLWGFELPSVATQDETIEEARTNARETIEATWRSPRCDPIP